MAMPGATLQRQNKSFLENMGQNYPPESQVGRGISFDGHQQQIPQMYGGGSNAGGINDVGSLGGFQAPNLGGFQYGGGYGAGISGINGGMTGYGQSNQGMLPFGNNMNPMMGTSSSQGTNAFNMGGFMNQGLPSVPLQQGQQYSAQVHNAPDGRNGRHHAPRRQPPCLLLFALEEDRCRSWGSCAVSFARRASPRRCARGRRRI